MCGLTLTPSSGIPKKFLVGFERSWIRICILMTNRILQFRFAGSWSFTLMFLRIDIKHALLVLDRE